MLFNRFFKLLFRTYAISGFFASFVSTFDYRSVRFLKIFRIFAEIESFVFKFDNLRRCKHSFLFLSLKLTV